MAGRYIIEIIFRSLLENLKVADTSRDWGHGQIELRLQAERFIKQNNGWLCEEVILTLLDRIENISTQPINLAPSAVAVWKL